MAVNPLNPAMPYSINASNETLDNARQHQEKNSNKKETKLKSKLEISKNNQNSIETPQNTITEPEATELISQIIDSSKVIELLSHRPKFKKSVRNCFLNKPNASENSQIPDVKKFNKAF